MGPGLIFTTHSQEHSVFYFQVLKFGSKTTSDWLNCIIQYRNNTEKPGKQD